MKYYSLKYTGPQTPPGQQYMWRIRIDSRYKVDGGLLAHEVRHVQHWYASIVLTLLIAIALGWFMVPELYGLAAAAPWAYHALYRAKWFRIMAELACYRKQLRVGFGPGLPYRSAEFAVLAMIGHGMDEDDARKALE